MVGPSLSSTSRPRRDQAGRYFVGALVLLGLVASVFLIFSNSLQLIRVGMVAALWAAAIGAMAATKYRKDAAVDQAKVRDLQKVYELQLDREISARREYEMGVEARVREEVGADAAEMAALRAELSVLRQSLQRLFDGDLPVDRPALHADAVRVRALPGSFGSAADPDAPANGNSPNAGIASRVSTPVFEPGHPHPAAFAGPDDEPVTAETSVVPADHDQSAPAGARLGSGNWPHALHAPGDAGAWADVYAASEADESSNELPASEAPAVGTAPAASSSAAAPAGPAAPAARTPVTPSAPASDAAAASPAAADASIAGAGAAGKPTPAPEPKSVVGTSSRRRRREDSGDGAGGRKLSVAEIMANLASEQQRSN